MAKPKLQTFKTQGNIGGAFSKPMSDAEYLRSLNSHKDSLPRAKANSTLPKTMRNTLTSKSLTNPPTQTKLQDIARPASKQITAV